MYQILIFLVLFSISFSTFAQHEQNGQIDQIFTEWDQPANPGGALGIIQNGKMIYAKGYGLADLEHDLEITPSSVFYIGSVSKQFVTFCILLLEEQGRLKLDDPIQKYLPDFPKYESPLTIRNFIHHTSGVRDYLTLMELKGRNYLDHIEKEEVYELIKQQEELNFTPGERYLYSNSCYFMLAMIIEKAAGQPIKAFAQEHIFGPLGMAHTQFYDNNTDLIKNRVFSYNKKDSGEGFSNLIMRFDLVGSGGVYSSIEDLYLWDQNFYHNQLGKGGQDIINKMHEEGMLNNGESSGYAFALVNGTYKGLKTVSHSGSLAGYRAQLLRFPEQSFSVIILSNRGDGNPTSKAYQVADIVLQNQFSQDVSASTEKTGKVSDKMRKKATSFQQVQLIGTYAIEPGILISISQRNDSLYAFREWNQTGFVITEGDNNFYQIKGDPSAQLQFSELKDNQAQVLTIIEKDGKTVSHRKQIPPLNEIELQAFTGEYYCKELDAYYQITLDNHQLQVKPPHFPSKDLKPYDKDQFFYQGNLLRFMRAGTLITGFEMDAGRVTNLKFTKD